MNYVICSIVTRNRLHLARVMMKSAAAVFPEAQRRVLVLDEAEDFFSPAAEPFGVTFAKELALPRFEEYAFVNNPTGLCCLLKPAIVLHLLEQTAADVVIYADSDTCWYHRPDALLDLLRSAAVAFTPHALGPLGPEACRTEGDIMRSGAFNAGLFAVRRGAEATSFLTWWLAAMCRERRLDPAYAYDQQFLGLAHVYFPWIGVLRDPGYNAAYWNLSERPIARAADGTTTAGGRPLAFFHYSYFDPATPDLLANRPPIVVPSTNGAMRDLQHAYAANIAEADAANCRRWPYRYDYFTDGKSVTSAQRDYYLNRVWYESDGRGNPFDPQFSTANYRGLKSVYAAGQPLPRLIRQLRRMLR